MPRPAREPAEPTPCATLTVRFTRVSATHHRLELARPGGAVTSRVLETRSVLFHDLVHFALESEAGLTDGFYGRLARGADYDQLAAIDGAATGTADLVAVERVVGPLQGAWRAGFDAAAFVARYREWLAQCEQPWPAWLTAELLERFAERLRALEGRWRATPFGTTMELLFPAGRERAPDR
jgi:hypothetical protein